MSNWKWLELEYLIHYVKFEMLSALFKVNYFFNNVP